jgi:hypothetical protein
MLDDLQWLHDMVRRDLQTCRDLAAAVLAGADVRVGIDNLQTNGPLFQLRVNCLQYCGFVHHHHALEDAMVFPAIRRAAPDLGVTIDRLQADHRQVSGLLDEVDAAADDLDGSTTAPARQRLAGALTDLAGVLTEHLAFEETVLAPVLRTWTHFPYA